MFIFFNTFRLCSFFNTLRLCSFFNIFRLCSLFNVGDRHERDVLPLLPVSNHEETCQLALWQRKRRNHEIFQGKQGGKGQIYDYMGPCRVESFRRFKLLNILLYLILLYLIVYYLMYLIL